MSSLGRSEPFPHSKTQKFQFGNLILCKWFLLIVLFFRPNIQFPRFCRFLRASEVPFHAGKTRKPITKTMLDLTVSYFSWLGLIQLFAISEAESCRSPLFLVQFAVLIQICQSHTRRRLRLRRRRLHKAAPDESKGPVWHEVSTLRPT